MRKKPLIKIGLQLLAVFLLIKHIDSILSTYSFFGELISQNSSYDKVVLMFAIVGKILYVGLLFLVILFSDKISDLLISGEKADEIVIPFKEQDIVLAGIILITGYCFLDSLSALFIESYYYFKKKSGSNYDLDWMFSEKNLMAAISKLILSVLIFHFRDKINSFIKSNSNSQDKQI